MIVLLALRVSLSLPLSLALSLSLALALALALALSLALSLSPPLIPRANYTIINRSAGSYFKVLASHLLMQTKVKDV